MGQESHSPEDTMLSIWQRLPVIVRAVLAGIVVTASGLLPWRRLECYARILASRAVSRVGVIARRCRYLAAAYTAATARSPVACWG
jgi:hypothetical protein